MHLRKLIIEKVTWFIAIAIGALSMGVVSLGFVAAHAASGADDFAPLDPFSVYKDPEQAVLAVQTGFDTDSLNIRVIAYDSADSFLEEPVARFDARLDETGLAIIPLGNLPNADHAFVAYLDENEDGKLNRNFLGKPTEPYVFSNNVRAKLSRPTFEQTRVQLIVGAVNIMTIQD